MSTEPSSYLLWWAGVLILKRNKGDEAVVSRGILPSQDFEGSLAVMSNIHEDILLRTRGICHPKLPKLPKLS